MGKPLQWKPGEGYDIHLLRDGPASKKLIEAIELGDVPADNVAFVPKYVGGTDVNGVTIDGKTGALQAGLHPDADQPKLTNFLLSIVGSDSGGTRSELLIRIHIHDSLGGIWLTPSSLTIHKDADECRFTVLAVFNDGVRGDITEWAQLSYKSVVPNTDPAQDSTDVLVSGVGILTAVTPGKSAAVTAKVELQKESKPSEILVSVTSEPATVLAKESWIDTAKVADFNFVVAGLRPGRDEKDKPRKRGTVVPNKDDPNSDKRDSVKSVVENALNILFIAEGFRQEQRGDFNNYVWKIVEHLRTDVIFQPFNLLKDAINYWSVFVPSQDTGISLLGDYYHVSDIPNKQLSFSYAPLPFPKEPDSAAINWSLEEMIYEVGLWTPAGPEPTNLPSLVDYWQKIYGDHVTTDRVSNIFPYWQGLVQHQPLNECNSAFGIRNADRPRATQTFADVMLGSDPRRTSDAHIFEFIQNLGYGKDPASGETYNVGAVWTDVDVNLVCFVCLTQKHAGISFGYFLVSTGRSWAVNVTAARFHGALDIDTPPVETMGRTMLASVISHELGHKLSLGDEYGDGAGTHRDVDHSEPNLQAKKVIVTTTVAPPKPPKTVYDKTHDIKWLWPRVAKAGMLDGDPTTKGSGFRVPLQKGHGKVFSIVDVVRFRQWPVSEQASLDPFALLLQSNGFVLKVNGHDDDGVDVDLKDGAGNVIDVNSPVPSNPGSKSWKEMLLDLFKPDTRYTLICPVTTDSSGTNEPRLVSEIIRNHIATSSAPLNAPPGNEAAGQETAPCVPNYSGTMTPTNLPKGFKLPRGLSTGEDLIGIYEGGGGHDCGVFRPAGRCKMRGGIDTTIPFCHVCRYVIVDRVDPTKHRELDRIYDRQYPK